MATVTLIESKTNGFFLQYTGLPPNEEYFGPTSQNPAPTNFSIQVITNSGIVSILDFSSLLVHDDGLGEYALFTNQPFPIRGGGTVSLGPGACISVFLELPGQNLAIQFGTPTGTTPTNVTVGSLTKNSIALTMTPASGSLLTPIAYMLLQGPNPDTVQYIKGATSTSVVASGLSPGAEYKYSVASWTGNQGSIINPSELSLTSPVSFVTIADPSTITVSNPTTTDVDFQIVNPLNQTIVNANVNMTSTLSPITPLFTSITIPPDISSSNTWVTVGGTALTAGQSYYAIVQNSADGTNYGPWAASAQFTTAASGNQLIIPFATATTSSIAVQWTISGTYNLNRLNPDGTITSATGLTGTSYSDTVGQPFIPGATYTYTILSGTTVQDTANIGIKSAAPTAAVIVDAGEASIAFKVTVPGLNQQYSNGIITVECNSTGSTEQDFPVSGAGPFTVRLDGLLKDSYNFVFRYVAINGIRSSPFTPASNPTTIPYPNPFAGNYSVTWLVA